MPPPGKCDIDVLTTFNHLYAPKLLGYKSFNAKVSIHNKSESWKLTRSYSEVRYVYKGNVRVWHKYKP